MSLTAAASARTVILDFDGCRSAVDQDQVLSILRIELGADGPPSEVALSSGPSTPLDALQIRIRCTGPAPDVFIALDDRPQTSLSFADAPVQMRPRTLALALAERVRRARLEPLSLPPPAPAPIPAVLAAMAPVEAGPPVAPGRMRVTAPWAISLGAATLTGFAVGSVITAVGDSNSSRGDLRGAGAAILGASCAPLVGGAVAFGYWLHDKIELGRQTAAYERVAAGKP